MGLSSGTIRSLAGALFHGEEFATPGVLYVGLLFSASANGQEVRTPSYVRQRVPPGMWSIVGDSGVIVSNSADILFPVADSDWGRVAAAAGFNSERGGDLIFWSPFVDRRGKNIEIAISANDQLRIPRGMLTVSIARV